MSNKPKIKKLQINLTNRWLYTLIVFFSLIVIGVFVYAVTPNPGHDITQIAPPDVCDDNQFLQWTGSAWACADAGVGGGSLWNQTGSDIYYNSGNVGIGTTTPHWGAELEVVDRVNIMGSEVSRIWLGRDGRSYLDISYGRYGTNAAITTYGAAQALILQELGGNVGIGTKSPGYKLDVDGSLHTTLYGNFSEGVILGTNDKTCSPAFAGMLRFRKDVCEGPRCSSYLEICMGVDGNFYDWYIIESVTEPF